MRWFRALNSCTIYCTLFFFSGLLIGLYWQQIKSFIRWRIGIIKVVKGGLPDIDDIHLCTTEACAIVPVLDPRDCHYYELNKEDFIWCPATRQDENWFDPPLDSACQKCHHYGDPFIDP